MSVRLEIAKEFRYCRCRACNMKILWFNIVLYTEAESLLLKGKPFVYALQAPGKLRKSYCPYCGARELWAEDEPK